jgi:hypothetical protein
MVYGGHSPWAGEHSSNVGSDLVIAFSKAPYFGNVPTLGLYPTLKSGMDLSPTCMEKNIATIARKPCQWPKEKQRTPPPPNNHHQIKLVASCAIQDYVASKSKKISLSLSLSTKTWIVFL